MVSIIRRFFRNRKYSGLSRREELNNHGLSRGEELICGYSCECLSYVQQLAEPANGANGGAEFLRTASNLKYPSQSQSVGRS